jgi:hypothetical protein
VLFTATSTTNGTIDSTIGTAQARCKTDLSRSRTHNEQTLVRPCGVMIGHAAFYNAEAVSNVLVHIVTLYQYICLL